MTRFADRVPAFHVAQLNIARMRRPLTDPVMAGFVRALEPVNALADAAPGFVWRLKDDEDGDATSIRPWGDDVIVNLSVWETLEDLRAFVFSSAHAAIMRERRDYFDPWGQGPHTVLFWVPSDELPDVRAARDALEALAAHGPDPKVFTFATPFLPDEVTGLSCSVEAVMQAERWAAAGRPPVVLLVSVQDLDRVVDDHGPRAADVVLGELAVRVRGLLPPSAYLARADEHELLALADHGTDAERLCGQLEAGVAGASIGVPGVGDVPVRVVVRGAPWAGTIGATIGPLRNPRGCLADPEVVDLSGEMSSAEMSSAEMSSAEMSSAEMSSSGAFALDAGRDRV